MLLENVCTLPLTGHVFTIALHPSQPLLAVGLESGHVQAFRLPENRHTCPDDDADATIDTAWRTRRHKGSCRAVEFGTDGEYAYSTGLDCLVKHFSSETGQVVSKIWVPRKKNSSSAPPLDAPTLLRALNPQALLLGTDSGALHILDLRARGSLAGNPAQTHAPHSDYVASIAPLPPTAASTSGFPKQWASVGGTTLAVTDVRRGVIARSEDQEDELLSAHFVGGVGPRGRQNNGVVAVGGGSGVVTLWDRGVWDDQTERIVVDKGVGGGGESIDAMAVVPEDARWGNGGRSVVVGMGDGALKVVDVQNRSVLETLRHDELDGVAGVGLDCLARLISAGGRTIKVWEESVARAEEDEGSEDEYGDSEDASEGYASEGDESEGDESEGDESEGDESEGDESEGDESEGDESEGDESEGDEGPIPAKDNANPQGKHAPAPAQPSNPDGHEPAKKGSAGKSKVGEEPTRAKGNKRPAPESSDDEFGDEEEDDSDDSGGDDEHEEKHRDIMRKRKEAAKKARLGPRGAHGILAFEGLD